MVNILLHSKTKKAPQTICRAFYLKLNELEIYQTDIDINHSLAFYNVHA